MAATFTAVTGTVAIRVGLSDVPVAIATFDVPATISVDRVSPDVVQLAATVSPDGILRSVVAELRRLADHWDPEIPTPTIDLPADLAPGFEVIHCPNCTDTMIGRPGDKLEHTEHGQHQYLPTLLGGL
jgi:hypothetical protein